MPGGRGRQAGNEAQYCVASHRLLRVRWMDAWWSAAAWASAHNDLPHILLHASSQVLRWCGGALLAWLALLHSVFLPAITSWPCCNPVALHLSQPITPAAASTRGWRR